MNDLSLKTLLEQYRLERALQRDDALDTFESCQVDVWSSHLRGRWKCALTPLQ